MINWDYIVLALSVALLLVLFYQDYKQRTVHISVYASLTLIALTYVYTQTQLTDFLFNALFILQLLLALTLYYSFKNRKITFIVNEQIGLGDIWFFFILALYLPLQWFMLFIIFSFLLILLFTFITGYYKKNKSVPLAGIQALLLIPILILYI